MSDEEQAAIIESIAANARRLREKRELTQERLAELASVDIRFVQKLESGKVNPSATTLVSLSNALGVRLSLLFRPATFERRTVGRPPKRGRNK